MFKDDSDILFEALGNLYFSTNDIKKSDQYTNPASSIVTTKIEGGSAKLDYKKIELKLKKYAATYLKESIELGRPVNIKAFVGGIMTILKKSVSEDTANSAALKEAFTFLERDDLIEDTNAGSIQSVLDAMLFDDDEPQDRVDEDDIFKEDDEDDIDVTTDDDDRISETLDFLRDGLFEDDEDNDDIDIDDETDDEEGDHDSDTVFSFLGGNSNEDEDNEDNEDEFNDNEEEPDEDNEENGEENGEECFSESNLDMALESIVDLSVNGRPIEDEVDDILNSI